MQKRGKGFTLIELLVVIAIIAILAAILFPVFAGAKRRAQMTACTSNLKQIGSAIMMYRDDWNSKLPYYLLDPGYSFVDVQGRTYSVGYPGRSWLMKYVKNAGVFICQSDITKGTGMFENGKGTGWPGWVNWPSPAKPPKVTTSYYYWASVTLQTPGNDPRRTKNPVMPAGMSWVEWKSPMPSKFMIVNCECHLNYGVYVQEWSRSFRPALYLDGSVRNEPGHERDGLN